MECDRLEESIRRKKKSAIENAEKRYRQLIDRRNALNEEARILREERDILNAEKKTLLNEIRKLKELRDQYVQKMREHKKRRNEYQSLARQLIDEKKNKNKGIRRSLPRDIEELDAEIKILELRQQTVPMSLKDEKDLIETIRSKMHHLVELQKRLEVQETVIDELDRLNASIDELFAKANNEHEFVIKYHQESQRYHERMVELFHEVSYLITESNKKHEAYLEARRKADKMHRKAVEMRSKILSLRKEEGMDDREIEKILEEHRRGVNEQMSDEALEKFVERSLEELKKTGKLTF